TRTGSLIFQNGSTSNNIFGPLGLADTTTAGASGMLSINSSSTVSLFSNLTLANRNVIGQTGTLNINGSGSLLTQIGASTITVGSAVNGTAAINIGTTATGGTLAT